MLRELSPPVAATAPDPTANTAEPFDADSTLTHLESPTRRHINMAVAVVAIAVYASYLVYRILFTINPDALLMSLLVYLAEVHGFFTLCFFAFQTWSLRARTVPPPPDAVTVDVFITTCNEDVGILRQTIRAALAMSYPHATYVLDDGRRSEVKALADALGCGYIARTSNEHAKAGNWNNAFRQTTGDVIATFDADHAPRGDFLVRTLGFFRDPKVALVQVPQRYHNVDSPQHRINWKSRRMHSEQDVRVNVIGPGHDHWNATMFCGTGAVLRRAALGPRGGLETGGIAEDVHTSLALHAAGWKSVYLDELLVTGLAPMDFTSLLAQRLRWAEGDLHIIRAINPLTAPGLTLPQRVCYGASMFQWTTGLAKLVFYLTPPWMLLSGSSPVANLDITFLCVYGAFLTSIAAAYTKLNRGHGRLLGNEVFSMATVFTLNRAVRRALTRRRPGEFVVTNKLGVKTPDQTIVFPYLALIVLSLLAIEWSVLALRVGVVDARLTMAVAGVWAVFNLGMMWLVVEMAVRPPQRRETCRFPAACPVSITSMSPTGTSEVGMTSNVSPTGCELLWLRKLSNGSRWPMSMRLGRHVFECQGEVTTAYHRKRGPWFVHGVHFVNLTQEQTDFLNDVLFNMVVPQLFEHLSQPSLTLRLWRRAVKWWRATYCSRARRSLVNVPVRLDATGGSVVTMLHDISASGFGVIAPQPLPLGAPATVTVLGAHPWSIDVSVARCQSMPASLPTFQTWLVGLRVDEAAHASAIHRRMSEEAAA